jgi:hypothetical protein
LKKAKPAKPKNHESKRSEVRDNPHKEKNLFKRSGEIVPSPGKAKATGT